MEFAVTVVVAGGMKLDGNFNRLIFLLYFHIMLLKIAQYSMFIFYSIIYLKIKW